LNDTEADEVKSLTTYGVIRGARQFIVGCVERGPRAMEDYGYSMERNILKATSMGLGTCWLGGTFRRSGFAARIRIGEDEVLPAVTPVGYPGGKRSVVDRLFRYTAASDKRKPWSELFYLYDTGNNLEEPQSGRYKQPLECVRLAPSASNKQPWRIILAKDRHTLHFYLKRTPGYGHMGKDIELQNVDMGIALCHFELSAAALGMKGGWSTEDPCITPAAMEYVVSWI